MELIARGWNLTPVSTQGREAGKKRRRIYEERIF
jgi:hypothetical protein